MPLKVILSICAVVSRLDADGVELNAVPAVSAVSVSASVPLAEAVTPRLAEELMSVIRLSLMVARVSLSPTILVKVLLFITILYKANSFPSSVFSLNLLSS